MWKHKYPIGPVLAREWLKYRYGVFDENGYRGDDLYPLYYSIPGGDPADLIVTDCSNKPIEYKFYNNYGDSNCTDKKLISKCRVEPSEKSLENVTSSLMYFHKQIPNMRHVCGKHSEHHHNPLARNKHNAFCQGQSVWDVLKKSSDFPNPEFLVDEMATEEEKNIEFIYVQEPEPKPKVVIAWETIQNIEKQGPTIVKAIRKFIYDLPMGSKCALLPFDDDVPEKVEFRELVDGPTRLFPISENFKDTSEARIDLAVNRALDILDADKSGDEDPEGTIILITSSHVTTDDDLLKRLNNSKVCLMLLDFNNTEGGSPAGYKQLAGASPCGTLAKVSKSSTDAKIFEEMFQTMESILPDAVDDRASKTLKTEVFKEGFPIDVPVDSTVEKVTFWIFGDIKIKKSINVMFGDEDVTSDIQEEAASDNNLRAASYSPTHEGTLKFKINGVSDVLVQVRATSKPGQYANGEVFTLDSTEAESPTQGPVILYANIRYGVYPIQNAEVKATISRPEAEDVTLEMYDDGAGDPDITANDGVYSRYFTDFSEEGYYRVTVSAKRVEKTSAGRLINGGLTNTTCCGQSVKIGNLSIPDLIKTFQTTFRATSSRPENGYKPSRIVDLRAEVDTAADNKVILKWTAPGGEADKGMVQNYTIKYFTTPEEVKNFDKGKLLNDITPTPKERGSLEEFAVNIKDFEESGVYYIAIQSSNNVSMNSETSNIAEVFIAVSIITTTEGIKPDKGSTNPRLIGIVVGIILGVIVIVIILYLTIYFMVVKPKRKKLEKDNENQTSNVQPSKETHGLSPINFVSADTLIKHHNDKERAKMENRDPPILKEEDFAENTTSTNGSQANNSVNQPGHSGVKKDNTEPLPPKSPKRTTFV